MSLIIYTTKEDVWLEKIKEYASFNSWSLSKAIRQILKAFVLVNMPEEEDIKKVTEIVNGGIVQNWIPSVVSAYNELTPKQIEEIKKIEIPTNKIDLATFEAQNMAKLNVNQNMEACIKEHTNNGAISCYMFDNAREYHPFCKKDCWTNSKIWHERVRP